MLILADRGMGDTYIYSAKAADELAIRLLFGNYQEEPITVYIDSFRVNEPLDEGDAFDRQFVVHGEVNTLIKTYT